jgi:hypothetical protein
MVVLLLHCDVHDRAEGAVERKKRTSSVGHHGTIEEEDTTMGFMNIPRRCDILLLCDALRPLSTLHDVRSEPGRYLSFSALRPRHQ